MKFNIYGKDKEYDGNNYVEKVDDKTKSKRRHKFSMFLYIYFHQIGHYQLLQCISLPCCKMFTSLHIFVKELILIKKFWIFNLAIEEVHISTPLQNLTNYIPASKRRFIFNK